MRNKFGGVLAFGLNTDHDGYNRFVSHLRIITNTVSLGHDESLIVFLGENDESITYIQKNSTMDFCD